MDYYQIWCNIRDSSKDLVFVENVQKYLGFLQKQGKINGFSISRRKLGFGPNDLGEFNICIKTDDLGQLETAFQQVATRRGEMETLHNAVYIAVKDVKFALYRDFPDPVRLEEE